MLAPVRSEQRYFQRRRATIASVRLIRIAEFAHARPTVEQYAGGSSRRLRRGDDALRPTGLGLDNATTLDLGRGTPDRLSRQADGLFPVSRTSPADGHAGLKALGQHCRP